MKALLRGLVVAFLVWGVHAPSAPALAQTPSTDPDAADQSASQASQPQDRTAPVDLGTIAVTSSRLEEPVSQTASALTVLTQEDFEQRQTTDIADQLRTVPGLHVLELGNRGDVSLLFTRGGEADHNLLLIDGVKANLGGGAFDFSDITTLGVDRIEIVRGPNAALYGSEAMSSVIQLFTRRGRGPPRATLRFRGGNHDTFEEQVSVSGGTDRYGYHVAVERVDTAGILAENSDYSNTTIASRFDFDPSGTLGFSTTVRYTDSRVHHTDNFAGDRFDPLDPNQYSERRRLIFGPRLVHRPTSWWRQRLQLGLLSDWFAFRDPDNGEPIDLLGSYYRTHERRLSADYASDFFLPPMLGIIPTFTLGAYVEDEQYDLNLLLRLGPYEGRGALNASRNAQSVYSQLRLEWHEMLFVTSGFRLDDGSTYGTHVNPRVSVAFIVPGLNTRLRGGYSHGLKAASFFENFSPASFARGNRDLKPEQSRSWEVGLSQPFVMVGLDGELGLTYFSVQNKNLIAYLNMEVGPDFANIQRARSRGLELEVRTSLPYGFTLRGAYTYLDTKVLDSGGAGAPIFVRGKPLVRRPEQLGSLTLNYRRERLNVNVHLFLKGHVTGVDYSALPQRVRRVRVDGYTRTDLAVSYLLLEDRWGIDRLSLEGRAKNLFDEDYEEVWGYSSPGASFLAGFRAEF